MFPFLWIPATVVASIFQVARNGLQRGLASRAGPWGATLVRFLFGLPFSLVFVAVARALTPDAHPNFTPPSGAPRPLGPSPRCWPRRRC